jgi:hypothetical protein
VGLDSHETVVAEPPQQRHNSSEVTMTVTLSYDIPQPVAPTATEAWISPKGEFFAVPECGHSQWAFGYFKAHGHEDDFAWSGAQTLEKQGWLHITGGYVYTRAKELLTAAQADALFATLAAYRNSGEGRYQFRAQTLEAEMRAMMSEED